MTLTALWLTTFAFCVAGSIVPFLNTEIYLLSVSALAPQSFLVPLVLAATAGQMVGKVAMFYGGRGVLRLPSDRVRRGVLALRARLEARPRLTGAILFSSATVGIPPLYLMSIACGSVGMGLASFVVIGTVGRLIHFGVVALVPQVARALLG